MSIALKNLRIPVMVDIDNLKLSQIYLSQKKIDRVGLWFEPSLRGFQPICVRDFFNNGELYITDGHTRVFAAWQAGVKQVPGIYDEDETVTRGSGQFLYGSSIEWCNRFNLQHISDLRGRILPEKDYENLWLGRCEKAHYLHTALAKGKICYKELNDKKGVLAENGLFIYGISKDCSVLSCENASGKLFDIYYDAL